MRDVSTALSLFVDDAQTQRAVWWTESRAREREIPIRSIIAVFWPWKAVHVDVASLRIGLIIFFVGTFDE